MLTSFTATDLPYETVSPSMSKTVSRFVGAGGVWVTVSEVMAGVVDTRSSVDVAPCRWGAKDVNGL
jgi:hypothetical protein